MIRDRYQKLRELNKNRGLERWEKINKEVDRDIIIVWET